MTSPIRSALFKQQLLEFAAEIDNFDRQQFGYKRECAHPGPGTVNVARRCTCIFGFDQAGSGQTIRL